MVWGDGGVHKREEDGGGGIHMVWGDGGVRGAYGGGRRAGCTSFVQDNQTTTHPYRQHTAHPHLSSSM